MRTLSGIHTKEVPAQFDWIAFAYLFFPVQVGNMINFLDTNTAFDSKHGLRRYLNKLPPIEKRNDSKWWKNHIAPIMPDQVLSPDRKRNEARFFAALTSGMSLKLES